MQTLYIHLCVPLTFFKKVRDYTLLYRGIDVITAEIKDSIIDMLIENADKDLFAELEFSKIKELGISRGEYNAIMSEFEDNGFVKRNGYSDYYDLKSAIYQMKEFGGYTLQRDAYFETIKNITLQVEKLKSTLSPSVIERINEVIEKAKNITELATAMETIRHLIGS